MVLVDSGDIFDEKLTSLFNNDRERSDEKTSWAFREKMDLGKILSAFISSETCFLSAILSAVLRFIFLFLFRDPELSVSELFIPAMMLPCNGNIKDCVNYFNFYGLHVYVYSFIYILLYIMYI